MTEEQPERVGAPGWPGAARSPSKPWASAQKAAFGIGALLLIIGVVIGFLPTSSTADGGSLACGSAFAGSGYRGRFEADNFIRGLDVAPAGNLTTQAQVDDCDAKRSTRRYIAIVMLVLGGVAAIGGPAFLADRTPPHTEDGA